jgi:hypothetical protein
MRTGVPNGDAGFCQIALADEHEDMKGLLGRGDATLVQEKRG